MTTSNVDASEIEKFSKSASRWWDTQGEFRFLHQLNPVRIDYLKTQIGSLQEKRILDLGCGGGIFSEGMARLGANVTGIDASKASIEVAKLHLLESELPITYEATTIENFSPSEKFDAVVCMEMLEHVPDPFSILSSAKKHLKPQGKLIVSTINRHPKAFLKAILGAEYLLRWIPTGTHHYQKFIRPSELIQMGRTLGLNALHSQGLNFNLLKNTFELTQDVSVNYFLTFQ